MVNSGSQWLYVITDSAMQNATNMTNFVDLLAEGGNVAFMYNATEFDGYCEVIDRIFAIYISLQNIELFLYAYDILRFLRFVRLCEFEYSITCNE